MSTWENVLNRREQIERNISLHNDEVKTRKLQKFLGANAMDF